MKMCLAILAMLLFANSARCADADRERPDEESLLSYMAGEYDLIGRKADSTATYTGHVTLRDENGVLQVTRTIEGKTDKCAARFDTVAGTDRIPVLRMHFHFDGKEYDATYRWQSDPDNYPDLPATFILPAQNRLASKRFSQSTDDGNAFGINRPYLIARDMRPPQFISASACRRVFLLRVSACPRRGTTRAPSS
jgi:hypothetical protein